MLHSPLLQQLQRIGFWRKAVQFYTSRAYLDLIDTIAFWR